MIPLMEVIHFLDVKLTLGIKNSNCSHNLIFSAFNKK